MEGEMKEDRAREAKGKGSEGKRRRGGKGKEGREGRLDPKD